VTKFTLGENFARSCGLDLEGRPSRWPGKLFADAEIAEDYVEQIFVIDGTSDAANAAQGQPAIRVRVKTGTSTRSPRSARQGLDLLTTVRG